MRKSTHREIVTKDNAQLGNPRKFKRFCRRTGMSDPVYIAYCEGETAGLRDVNPYPPGRRHDEWNRGQNNIDPMGDMMGENR